MAKAQLNPALEQIRGELGGFVYRTLHGKQVVSRKPDMSRVKWSAAQKAHRLKFRRAVAYARAAMADEAARAIYEREAAQKGKRPFDLAVSDYFKGRDLLAGSG
jgi:hypothetical protein